MNDKEMLDLLHDELNHINAHLSFKNMDAAYYDYWGKQQKLYIKMINMVRENDKLKSQLPAERDKFLSEEEIEVFNAYMDDCMDPVAFGNSDFSDIYDKLVGDKKCNKRFNWAELDR